MLDELRALAIFAHIVQSGSIRGAARALSLSPSVVSHHLRSLEERVGTSLLYRTTRKLSLTTAGERLAAEAQSMVACAERGLDGLRGASVAMRGTLRVTVPAFLAATRFPRELAEFAHAYPNVSLTVSFTEVPRDLLTDGFDLALRMGPLTDSTHQTRLLAQMERALVATPDLHASRKRPRTPEDLAHWPFVHLGSRPPVLQLRHHTTGKETKLTYTPRITADSASAIHALMLAGAGLATLPRVLIHDDLTNERAVEVLKPWKVASVAVRAVWPPTTVKTALTHHFLDFISPRIATLFSSSAT